MSNLIRNAGLVTAGAVGVASAAIIGSQGKKISKLKSENSLLNEELELIKSGRDNYNVIVKENRELKKSIRRLLEESEDNIVKIKSLNRHVAELKDEIENNNLLEPKKISTEGVANEDSSEIDELKAVNNSLKIRCEGQTVKIKELKAQLRESKDKLKENSAKFNGFKAQLRSIIETRKDDRDAVKQISKAIDKVGKLSKSGGK